MRIRGCSASRGTPLAFLLESVRRLQQAMWETDTLTVSPACGWGPGFATALPSEALPRTRLPR
jgi:hypothetical protein